MLSRDKCAKRALMTLSQVFGGSYSLFSSGKIPTCLQHFEIVVGDTWYHACVHCPALHLPQHYPFERLQYSNIKLLIHCFCFVCLGAVFEVIDETSRADQRSIKSFTDRARAFDVVLEMDME